MLRTNWFHLCIEGMEISDSTNDTEVTVYLDSIPDLIRLKSSEPAESYLKARAFTIAHAVCKVWNNQEFLFSAPNFAQELNQVFWCYVGPADQQ
jgi:hypothetical protein